MVCTSTNTKDQVTRLLGIKAMSCCHRVHLAPSHFLIDSDFPASGLTDPLALRSGFYLWSGQTREFDEGVGG